MQSAAVPALEVIEDHMLFIRDEHVLLDSELAALYEVPTKALN